jgi:hypothetical protein
LSFLLLFRLNYHTSATPHPLAPPHYILFESSLSCLLQAIFEEGINFLTMACNPLCESMCQILINNVEDLQKMQEILAAVTKID